MNRPRKNKGPYPPCFYQKHGAFYLVRDNKWTRLGADLGVALAEYGRLMGTAGARGMPKLIDVALKLIEPRLAKSTRAQYKHAASILKRKLKQFDPQDVKARHVAALKQSMTSTPNMANRAVSLLRQVFDYAVEQQMVDVNPCVGVQRLPEKKRERLLSAEEWQAIHDHAGPRLRVIMRLQFLTGQRIGDVLSIKRSQITEEGIVFQQQKTGARLLVAWSPDLLAAVEDAKALAGDVPSVTLLRSTTGGPPDYRSVSDQFRKAAAAAGVEDVRLNDARAMSATATKKQGKSARALLGHTSETMTARYLRDREVPTVEGPALPKIAK